MANCLQIIAVTLAIYYAFDLCKASPTIEKIKPSQYGPEKALARDLLANYKRVGDPLNGRPVERANQTVVVTVGLTLLSIVDVNEQVTPPSMTMNCWVEHLWNDPFLQWDRSDYEGISTIPVFVKDIWTPDTVVSNSRGNMDLFDERSKATIYSDGDIYWTLARTLSADCKPVDQDTLDCSVKYQAWTSSDDKVRLKYKSDRLDLSNYVSNPNWEIVSTEARRVEIKYTCCEELYGHLVFQLVVKRRRENSITSLMGAFKRFVSN